MYKRANVLGVTTAGSSPNGVLVTSHSKFHPSILNIISNAMVGTASPNDAKVYLKVQQKGTDGERFGIGDTSATAEERLQKNNAPVFDNSSSALMNAGSTPINEEREQPASVPVDGGQRDSKSGSSDETIENLVSLFRDFLETASSTTTHNHTNTQRNTSTTGRSNLKRPSKFFGLSKSLSPEIGSNNRYNYEQKNPEDRFGEETADNARVWLTYLDEAEAFDRERVEGWKETVDVLLVFAGLFSGVITTFVSQASQSLQQDNTQISASLLFEIAQILRAQLTGAPINPNLTLTTPTSSFVPSTNAVLVNGLWFTSLAITLSTALFAVLAKQWLYYYVSSIPGTANKKVRARQLRFNGFELWKVAAIIDLLPILLHLSVGIFLTGIIILLFPLDVSIAWTIVIITVITYTLYFISVILPIRYPDCPYTTSLTIYVGILFFVLRESFRWFSTVSDKGLRAIRRTINIEVQRAIWYLFHYLQDLSRRAFAFISRLVGVVCRGFQSLQPTIVFTEKFPGFTKWREGNIKQAIENATTLDFDALNWLYTTSPDRSVHRMIARCAAIHPIISKRFAYDTYIDVRQTLDFSKKNITDLRYGLCLGIQAYPGDEWRLFRYEPDVAESQLEEAEYQSYLRIANKVLDHNCLQTLHTAIDENLKLPLVMWCYVLERAPRDAAVAVQILTRGQNGLFRWKFDPTRDTIRNAGAILFNSNELGLWKFELLFRYFELGTPDYSSEAKSFKTRYLLLVTVYRNLTSDQPLIPEKQQRQKSLQNLFGNFRFWVNSFTQLNSFENSLTFFNDIFCNDSFWCESMTNQIKCKAAQCLGLISASVVSDAANNIPFTKYGDICFVYKWFSRDHLNSRLLWHTPPLFILLLVPQNRRHLRRILSNDPEALSHFSQCLQHLKNYYRNHEAGEHIRPIIIDLLKSAGPKTTLFTVLYSSHVLVQFWGLLAFCDRDTEQEEFFSLVKSQLNDSEERLNELFAAISEQARSDGLPDIQAVKYWGADKSTYTIRNIFRASERGFRQFLGDISYPKLKSAAEQSAPKGAVSDELKDLDIEKHA